MVDKKKLIGFIRIFYKKKNKNLFQYFKWFCKIIIKLINIIQKYNCLLFKKK